MTKKEDFLLNKIRKLIANGRFDYEYAGETSVLISDNGKTESFLDFCWKHNIEVDEVLETIVNQNVEQPRLDVNKNNYDYLLIWELSEKYSKDLFPKINEELYCKIGINISNVAKVVIHRSYSDVKK